jgi:hypothetical protein
MANPRGINYNNTQVQLANSERIHNRLVMTLRRQGISNVDTNTPEGQLLADLLSEFENAADKHIPSSVRAACAESIVEALLLKRSLMTHLLTARRPSATPTEHGKAQRQAFQVAINGLAKMNDILLKNFKVLGLGSGLDERKPTLEKILNEINAEAVVERTALGLKPEWDRGEDHNEPTSEESKGNGHA